MMWGITRPTRSALDKFYGTIQRDRFLMPLPPMTRWTNDIHFVIKGYQYRIMAYCWIRGWDENWPDKCLGLLVHQDCRRQGYGELLARFVLQAGKERNIARVRLHVHPQNKAALSLYRKIGFAFDGTKRADGELIGYYCYD